MWVKCLKCNRKYDLTKEQIQKGFTCQCGYKLGFVTEGLFEQVRDICKNFDLGLEEEKIQKITNAQDRIIVLILNSDYPKVDVEIEMQKFRELVNNLFPEKAHLYEMIYEPRFKRLWKQFREVNED